MLIFIKVLLFMLISTLVTLFLFYIHFAFILDVYFQWFFNDVQDMQQYDYIIGELYLINIYLYLIK